MYEIIKIVVINKNLKSILILRRVLKMDIIKVSSKSAPQKVAGAIANLFRESKQ